MSIIQSITDDERQSLVALSRALEPFKEMIRANSPMPLSLVMTFLLVAMRDDQTVSDLSRASSASHNAVSRQLQDLSDKNRNGGAGFGVIEQRTDLLDQRYVTSRLTPKGRALVARISSAMARRPVARAA